MKIILCTFLEIWSMVDIIFLILVHFLPFYPLTTQKIKILKKWKKPPGNIISHECTYHKWQSYDVRFLRYGVRQTEFFVIPGYFLPFYFPNSPKNQNEKKKKEKREKHFEISSFYNSAPKIIIICYTVSEIWCITDVIVIFNFGLFLPFSSLTVQKIKISKKC